MMSSRLIFINPQGKGKKEDATWCFPRLAVGILADRVLLDMKAFHNCF
jgi:hypothetical protein